ncbi:MAG: Bax inhibitor-1/YccA family protein, partial [Proteobacteria bacterium]|nr:Bax inhibitor-1/YccA family protein [Pseudomonadota bacterium]
MAQIDQRYVHGAPASRAGTSVTVDEGLRAHMLRVYNYLAGGIGLAAIMAYAIYNASVTTDPAIAAATLRNGVLLTSFGKALFASGWILAIKFAPIALLLVLAFTARGMSVGALNIVYWVLVATIGAGASTAFIQYKLGSVGQVFGITALSFAALSLYGYTTKKDLSGWGSFLFMGLIGIILASLANFFFQSSALQFAVSVIGVLVFAGFTAYDTQQIKDEYIYSAGDAAALGKAAVWGALSLFLDFVILFQLLLLLLGNRD